MATPRTWKWLQSARCVSITRQSCHSVITQRQYLLSVWKFLTCKPSVTKLLFMMSWGGQSNTFCRIIKMWVAAIVRVLRPRTQSWCQPDEWLIFLTRVATVFPSLWNISKLKIFQLLSGNTNSVVALFNSDKARIRLSLEMILNYPSKDIRHSILIVLTYSALTSQWVGNQVVPNRFRSSLTWLIQIGVIVLRMQTSLNVSL